MMTPDENICIPSGEFHPMPSWLPPLELAEPVRGLTPINQGFSVYKAVERPATSKISTSIILEAIMKSDFLKLYYIIYIEIIIVYIYIYIVKRINRQNYNIHIIVRKSDCIV